MAVTMREVAKLAGVSIKTVSNVLNDEYPYIRPETRSRVLDAVEELGYRLNASARALRTKRSGVVGLALPEMRAPYFAELADEVFKAANEVGLRVVVERVEPVEHVSVAHMIGPGSQLLDGALVAPASQADVAMETAPPGFPIVVLGDRRLAGDVDQIYIANARGATLAVDHLIAVGCRRIAVLGADDRDKVGNAVERTTAYVETLARHGHALDRNLLLATSGWTTAAGAEAIEDALGRGVEFDAVFALSDSLALGALSALNRRGKRVPDDVAVVGFDDIDDARHAVPPLTTVAVDRVRTARQAVRLLKRRLEQGEGDGEMQPTAIEIDTALVVRESSVPATRA